MYHDLYGTCDAVDDGEDGPRSGVAEHGQGDTEDEAEEDQAQHVAPGSGVHRVARHDVHERLHPEAGLRRRLHPSACLDGELLHEAGPDVGVEAAPRPHHVDQEEPEGTGGEGRGEKDAEAASADPAELGEVSKARHAQDERGEDQEDHDHEQHPEEDLPHGVGDVVDDPEKAGRVSPQNVGETARSRAHGQTHQDLAVEREPTRSHVAAPPPPFFPRPAQTTRATEAAKTKRAKSEAGSEGRLSTI